jgi:hypothetical protein
MPSKESHHGCFFHRVVCSVALWYVGNPLTTLAMQPGGPTGGGGGGETQPDLPVMSLITLPLSGQSVAQAITTIAGAVLLLTAAAVLGYWCVRRLLQRTSRAIGGESYHFAPVRWRADHIARRQLAERVVNAERLEEHQARRGVRGHYAPWGTSRDSRGHRRD